MQNMRRCLNYIFMDLLNANIKQFLFSVSRRTECGTSHARIAETRYRANAKNLRRSGAFFLRVSGLFLIRDDLRVCYFALRHFVRIRFGTISGGKINMRVRPFDIVFLGTGNAQTKMPQNSHTNALAVVDGHEFLIDCGFLCPMAFEQAHRSMDGIEAYFISHLHGDHVMGLEEVCFRSYFCLNRRIPLWLPSQHFSKYSGIAGADIWDNCLRASLETYDMRLHPPKLLTLSDYADITLLYEGVPFEFYGLPFELIRVEHAPNRPCYGLKIGDKAVYTGDSTFSLERIETWLNSGVECIFHDVSFCENCFDVHANYKSFSDLPAEIARHIIFMHLPDKLDASLTDMMRHKGYRFAERLKAYHFD